MSARSQGVTRIPQPPAVQHRRPRRTRGWANSSTARNALCAARSVAFPSATRQARTTSNGEGEAVVEDSSHARISGARSVNLVEVCGMSPAAHHVDKSAVSPHSCRCEESNRHRLRRKYYLNKTGNRDIAPLFQAGVRIVRSVSRF